MFWLFSKLCVAWIKPFVTDLFKVLNSQFFPTESKYNSYFILCLVISNESTLPLLFSTNFLLLLLLRVYSHFCSKHSKVTHYVYCIQQYCVKNVCVIGNYKIHCVLCGSVWNFPCPSSLLWDFEKHDSLRVSCFHLCSILVLLLYCFFLLDHMVLVNLGFLCTYSSTEIIDLD